MIYEVRYKNGVDLDYFGSLEAAEMYLERHISKLNDLRPRPEGPWTEEDFEIREKEDQPWQSPDMTYPRPNGYDYTE